MYEAILKDKNKVMCKAVRIIFQMLRLNIDLEGREERGQQEESPFNARKFLFSCKQVM